MRTAHLKLSILSALAESIALYEKTIFLYSFQAFGICGREQGGEKLLVDQVSS